MQTPFDQHDNNFDFIRLALAVLVMFSHSYPLGTGSELVEPFNLLTRHQVTGGAIGVDLFFIISGFLITASYERSASIASFLKKRVFRIYPAFVVAMLCNVLIALFVGGARVAKMSTVSHVLDFVTQTIRLREITYAGAFAGNPGPGEVNGSVWSIQYEFWCYIGVVLLGVSGVLRSNRVLVGLFCSSIVLSVLFVACNWKPSGNFLGVIFGYPPFWARLLPMYLAGIVFYRLRAHLALKTSWIAVAFGLLVAAALLPYGWPALFPVSGTFLVLTLAFHPAIRLHGWSRYGDFSYGTYLYAFPVQQVIVHFIGHPVSSWLLFDLAAPVTLGCAFISWHAVEKWFLRRAHRPMREPLPVRAAADSSHVPK